MPRRIEGSPAATALARRIGAAVLLIAAAAMVDPASGQESLLRNGGIVELRFTPTRFTQLAVWVESADGQLFRTVRLTSSVARHGIGNRPGASQMNSGFHWPYGRREGVLPVWAKRRSVVPGARSWKRVIFQERFSEGHASRSGPDASPDNYFCLSFNIERSSKDALDAVTCATQFNSDKGRYITQVDVDNGYSEPYEDDPGVGRMRPLSLESLYPPRRDVTRCTATGCVDHPDVDDFKAHALDVMPELDAVTMATPSGDVQQRVLFDVPLEWPAGAYRACVEANVEGDYNETWSDLQFPTPRTPGENVWDGYAKDWGYAYRGQPSVVYCVDIELGRSEAMTFAMSEPSGSAGTWRTDAEAFGDMLPMWEMTDDPVGAPGSGADRLQLDENGDRLAVTVQPPGSCEGDQLPSAISELTIARHSDERHAHQYAQLSFRAAGDDRGVHRYDVRVSTSPIDEASFMAAEPARQATLDAEELLLPTETAPGEPITADIGGLVAETHYYVGVRAMDACTQVGPISVAEFETPQRVFATVTPCFIATAAYGSPLAQEIGVLRRVRDRYLLPNAVGRAIVEGYYTYGPALADVVAADERLRSVARWAMTPVVAIAGWLDAR
jgi:hypothetical protein